MAFIKICVVPNCSQRLSRLILWIMTTCATYWTHTTAVCVFNGSLNPPSASTHPRNPLIHDICDITVAVNNVAQNPAVLTS